MSFSQRFLLSSWARPSKLLITVIRDGQRHTRASPQCANPVHSAYPPKLFPLSLSALNRHSSLLRLTPIYRQALDVLICAPVTLPANTWNALTGPSGRLARKEAVKRPMSHPQPSYMCPISGCTKCFQYTLQTQTQLMWMTTLTRECQVAKMLEDEALASSN